MSELDPITESLARTNHVHLVRGCEAAGRAALSQAMRVDESTISKLKCPDELKINFESISVMLAVMGYKIVPANHMTVDKEKLEHDIKNMTHLARMGLDLLEKQGVEAFSVE